MKRSMSYPYLLWMLIFTIIPMILVVVFSFINTNGEFSMANYQRVIEPIYLSIIYRSLLVAFVSTVICLVLGYPVAYILSKEESDSNNILIFLLLIPMWMNFLLRTYSWMTLLDNNGVINYLIKLVGGKPLIMLNTRFAIVLGMVYNFLPFMVIPVYTVLKKMDKNVIEAAQDLGANPVQVFFKVILPLSIPGVISGIAMVFMPAVTTFSIPNLLGGNKQLYVGSLIEQQFLRVGYWGFGSALSVILMLFIILSMVLFNFVDKQKEEDGGLF